MARKLSPTLIGGFVVGALALAVGAVLILAGRQWFTRPVTCVMAFDSSVAGLSVGAPVQFRGVPLGRVSDIQFRYGRSEIVIVTEMEISRIQGLNPKSAPAEVVGAVRAAVAAGLRAQLELQSLVTGQLYVGLDFYPGTRATLTGTDPTQCEIPTIPTKLAELQDQMKKIMEELGNFHSRKRSGRWRGPETPSRSSPPRPRSREFCVAPIGRWRKRGQRSTRSASSSIPRSAPCR